MVAEEQAEETADVPVVEERLPASHGDPPHQLTSGRASRSPVTTQDRQELVWREWVASKALKCEPLPAILERMEGCILLLKEILGETRDGLGTLPCREKLEAADRLVLEAISDDRERTKLTQSTKRMGKKSGKGSKRSLRIYHYARTQELFRNNPGMLAKCVREQTDWTKLKPVALASQDIKELYSLLWGTKPAINPQFLNKAEEEMDIKGVLPPITGKNIKDRMARTKRNTVAGPDGFLKKDICQVATMEMLRLWFNITMIRNFQPKVWRGLRSLPKMA